MTKVPESNSDTDGLKPILVFDSGIGGLTGLPLAFNLADLHLHDTYYVIGHFHYVVAPGILFGFFAGIRLPARDHDVGSGTNQAFSNGPTDTPGSSGNDGSAAGEIKQ